MLFGTGKPSQAAGMPALLSREVCNNEIVRKELTDETLEEFSTWIDEIRKSFGEESNNIDLRLIYDYSQLNAYGKMIMDKVGSSVCDLDADLSHTEKKKGALQFKEICKTREGDKYSFVFWALMVMAVDDTDKEWHLSQICDLGSWLGINDEEMINIVRLVRRIL